MSIDMYLPGLPAIAREFGAPTSTAQFTLSSFFIGLPLAKPYTGRWPTAMVANHPSMPD